MDNNIDHIFKQLKDYKAPMDEQEIDYHWEKIKEILDYRATFGR